MEAIDAFYCQLCHKVVRADRESGPDDALQKHCKSNRHIFNYKELHPEGEEITEEDEDEEDEDINDVSLKICINNVEVDC